MKKKFLWALLLLLLLSPVAHQASPVEELNKPFAVGNDIYNFNITMESFIIKPQNTYTKLYPNSDHFTNTRLTLIDGLRLLLGERNNRGNRTCSKQIYLDIL